MYKDERLALYQVTMTLPDGVIQFAEIFRVRVSSPTKFINESYERYPSDELFGISAWCCSTLPSLRKILLQECNMTVEDLQVDLSFLLDGVDQIDDEML